MSEPFNLYALKKPQQDAGTATRTFTDPYQPGVEATITLKPPIGFIASGNISILGESLVEQYATGKVDRNGNLLPGESAPGPIMNLGFDPIKIEPWFCRRIARVMGMHVGTDAFKEMQFREWAAFSQVAPTMFADLLEWVDEIWINADDPDALKNALAASTGAASALPPTGTPPATPPTSSISANPSEASTND